MYGESHPLLHRCQMLLHLTDYSIEAVRQGDSYFHRQVPDLEVPLPCSCPERACFPARHSSQKIVLKIKRSYRQRHRIADISLTRTQTPPSQIHKSLPLSPGKLSSDNFLGIMMIQKNHRSKVIPPTPPPPRGAIRPNVDLDNDRGGRPLLRTRPLCQTARPFPGPLGSRRRWGGEVLGLVEPASWDHTHPLYRDGGPTFGGWMPPPPRD